MIDVVTIILFVLLVAVALGIAYTRDLFAAVMLSGIFSLVSASLVSHSCDEVAVRTAMQLTTMNIFVELLILETLVPQIRLMLICTYLMS